MILLAVVIISSIGGISAINAQEDKIPTWVKGVFQYYVNGDIKDSELIDALEFLIEQKVLDVGEKQYEPFSKEKFPTTGGFNPAWLEGEKDKIIESCNEARTMGYENPYCKYVQ